MKHEGDLFINEKNKNDFLALEEVTGSLYIRADAQLPVLRSAHGVNGRLVCVKKYGLWYSVDYRFYAGCQGPMTKRQALALSKKWDDRETAEYMAKFISEIDDKEEVA